MSKNSENHLPHYRVRPRFLLHTHFSIEDLATKIKDGLKKQNATCKGQVLGNQYITLYLPFEEQHYWSPQLSLTLEAQEEGSLLRGFYGPRPSVWTMFVFIYFIIAFTIVIILVIGCSNYYLGKSILILWLVPILIVVFLSLYLVAFIGQKFSHDQMVILHQFLEETTGLEIIDEEK